MMLLDDPKSEMLMGDWMKIEMMDDLKMGDAQCQKSLIRLSLTLKHGPAWTCCFDVCFFCERGF